MVTHLIEVHGHEALTSVIQREPVLAKRDEATLQYILPMFKHI